MEFYTFLKINISVVFFGKITLKLIEIAKNVYTTQFMTCKQKSDGRKILLLNFFKKKKIALNIIFKLKSVNVMLF